MNKETQIKVETFEQLQQAQQKHFEERFAGKVIYKVVNNREAIWETYINAFEAGATRQEYECNACNSFIRRFGGLVVIENDALVSLWRFETGNEEFQPALDALANYVEAQQIDSIFVLSEADFIDGKQIDQKRLNERKLGKHWNFDLREGKPNRKWHHFALQLPKETLVLSEAGANKRTGLARDNAKTLYRGLSELTAESITTALELIETDSLEKGAQFLKLLQSFKALQEEFLKTDERKRTLFCWQQSIKSPALAKVRGMSIGTFLEDLSKGTDLETAVIKFGKVMSPHNYKRPKAIVTASTLKAAEKTIEDLGLAGSLARRLAVTQDVSINNSLWVDRTTQTLERKQGTGSLLTQVLTPEVKLNNRDFKNVDEVNIKEFISKVLPKCTGVEVYLENRHQSNLVSLIAPVNLDSPALTRWSNGMSWVYYGGLADSFKQKVKDRGGKIEGLLRNSLWWFNYDDLDIRLKEPNGVSINYNNKKSQTGGYLDLDENANRKVTRDPVENIIYPFNSNILEGEYLLEVNQFELREHIDVGFKIEIESEGVLHKFSYPTLVEHKDTIKVAKYLYKKGKGIEIMDTFNMITDNVNDSKEMWGLKTNDFHKVTIAMKSPNHWSGAIGSEHVFFMLEGAMNDDPLIRGFFNEQLKPELNEHRRVFETLGSKLNVEAAPSDKQLSGVGFELTKRNDLIIKVTGEFNKVFRVKI